MVNSVYSEKLKTKSEELKVIQHIFKCRGLLHKPVNG